MAMTFLNIFKSSLTPSYTIFEHPVSSNFIKAANFL